MESFYKNIKSELKVDSFFVEKEFKSMHGQGEIMQTLREIK
jgi:hypothetical protein